MSSDTTYPTAMRDRSDASIQSSRYRLLALFRASKKCGRLLLMAIALYCQPGLTPEVRAADQEMQDQERASVNERWLTLGWLSLHANSSAERNGLNYGLGAEFGISPSWSLTAGGYQNSFETTSFYAGGLWKPWSKDHWKLALMLGVANGYRRVNDGGVFPYTFPMLQYESDRFGANIALIPPVGQVTHGLIALQFKFRL